MSISTVHFVLQQNVRHFVNWCQSVPYILFYSKTSISTFMVPSEVGKWFLYLQRQTSTAFSCTPIFWMFSCTIFFWRVSLPSDSEPFFGPETSTAWFRLVKREISWGIVVFVTVGPSSSSTAPREKGEVPSSTAERKRRGTHFTAEFVTRQQSVTHPSVTDLDSIVRPSSVRDSSVRDWPWLDRPSFDFGTKLVLSVLFPFFPFRSP
jgi:hypothetical protein